MIRHHPLDVWSGGWIGKGGVNDANGDGQVNGGDIDPFFQGLGQGVCPGPGPNPVIPPSRGPKTSRPNPNAPTEDTAG